MFAKLATYGLTIGLVLGFAATVLAQADSTNYNIPRDVQPSGGGEKATSDNYTLSSTIGEFGIGPGDSANYALTAGYRQVEVAFISMSCTDTLTLTDIAGTGESTSSITCTVITDATPGYQLSWIVQTGSGGTSTGHMISELEDIIAAYSPAVAGTPETWSIASTASAWGARLSSTSTDTDAKWGTDSSDEKWLNVGTGSYTVVERTTRTSDSGSSQIIQFKVEVGADKVQPTGSYEVPVVLTATANL